MGGLDTCQIWKYRTGLEVGLTKTSMLMDNTVNNWGSFIVTNLLDHETHWQEDIVVISLFYEHEHDREFGPGV